MLLGELQAANRESIRIARVLRFAAVLCVITACTGLATHYVRGFWFSLLSSAVLVEAAVNALLGWIARRDPVAAGRIAIAIGLSFIPDFRVLEELRSPLAMPIICAVFSIGIVVGLWPLRVRGAKNQ